MRYEDGEKEEYDYDEIKAILNNPYFTNIEQAWLPLGVFIGGKYLTKPACEYIILCHIL